MKKFFFPLFLGVFSFYLLALDLSVTPDDIVLQKVSDDGLLLLVKKKPDIQSVILCETTKDPNGQLANYTFRDRKKNAYNGEEMRMLDGTMLSAEEAHYSIVSSTVIQDSFFGNCFKLYLPSEMDYGYPTTRHGTQKLENGMFINVRAFEKPFADYSGAFQDNPFVLKITEALPENMDKYNSDTVSTFTDIAQSHKGKTLYSEGPEDLADKINQILQDYEDLENLDMVLVVDATNSMADDFVALENNLLDAISESVSKHKKFRIGLVAFKDYGDEFLYNGLPVKVFQFTENLEQFSKNLCSFRISGGRDYEEAVYEGMYAACEFMNWDEDASKRLLLIGDAAPHQIPRGTGLYSNELVHQSLENHDIYANAIVLYDPDRPTNESILQ